ncbi:molybdopterin-dependent oxidoreductase [soil metagenome]
MSADPVSLRFRVNGSAVALSVAPMRRLSDVLREDLGLTGTKVGCDAGDCGACTVHLDGRPVCACLVPVAQVAEREVDTVEGLGAHSRGAALQDAFLDHGAAQCGVCIPGMLMAASALAPEDASSDAAVEEALGGVLCRCTGYRQIRTAIAAADAAPSPAALTLGPLAGQAVGARIARLDGRGRVDGSERYGADSWPPDSLTLRVIRSPHAHARVMVGDLRPILTAHPGIAAILTAADIPGQNRFGIYPTGKDQPVLAETARYRGEPVLAVVGEPQALAEFDEAALPITWQQLPVLDGMDEALHPDAAPLHEEAPDNVLVHGRVARGDLEAALARSADVVEGIFETSHLEHAYIEPEAGSARRVGDRLEVFATTQTPYMDRDELALIVGLQPEQVRVIPSACGGGFGGKLDLAIQPLLAVAAWLLDRPVRGVYTRPESMRSTTKRHPARMRISIGADTGGRLTAVRFEGDFDTGAYASWGPTVASRVPIHASGPYEVPAVLATTRAVYTNGPIGGAFRGFGVPQAALGTEVLMDELAERLGIDPLELRLRNALRAGSSTATGQVLRASVGLPACLEALRPHWLRLRAEADDLNAHPASRPSAPQRGLPVGRSNGLRLGVGLAAMWYGIGNTSMPNPSTMRMGVRRDGSFVLFSGAVDIGQGSTTVLAQVAADAMGVAVSAVEVVSGDTDRTPDSGKTSASRQTYVSGNAARLAAEELRRRILRLAEVGADAILSPGPDGLMVIEAGPDGPGVRLELERLSPDGEGCVVVAEGTYDPVTTVLDPDGQGVPYETYAFGAQIAVVEVDPELGTVFVRRIVAAHDVGRAVNPTLVEGQIHGGVAQGIGMALMEEYVPGRTDNLHDYLIPTIGDVPAIETILVEDPEPAGPYGAKGVGEPALIATAPAILAAIRHATGVRLQRVPVTPDRLRAAILAAG